MAVVDVDRERKTTMLHQTKIAKGEDPDASDDDEVEWEGVGVHEDIYGGSLRGLSQRGGSVRGSQMGLSARGVSSRGMSTRGVSSMSSRGSENQDLYV